jgi:riboflavin kinase/FMN adenylyltransferase
MRAASPTVPPVQDVPHRREAPLVIEDARGAPAALRGGVLLLGNFDGFHRGHKALHAQGRLSAGTAALGIMSPEPHPRRFFDGGASPFRLSSPAAKLALFARQEVDFVYMPRFDAAFAGLDADAFIREILVAALGVREVVIGPDFRFGNRRAGTPELLRRRGAALGFSVAVVAPVTLDGVACSSSAIRQAIAAGDIARANRLLGHEWLLEARLEGPVRGGTEQTVAPYRDCLHPPPGRYAVGVTPLPLAPEKGRRGVLHIPPQEGMWVLESRRHDAETPATTIGLHFEGRLPD